MDRLESMSLLLAVAEAGSLSAAARKIGMPLASLSRKISDLERHLNARLFNRSTRQLSLTDAGRSYVAACRRILDDIGEAERAVAGEYSAARGELAVTAPILFGQLHVLPVVTEFLAVYPDVDVRMDLSDHVTHLLDEHIDVGLRIGRLPDSNLMATRVGIMRWVVCASPEYLATHGEPHQPEALAGHACVSFERLSGAQWLFQQNGQLKEIAIHARLRVNTAAAAVEAATAGTGIVRVFAYQAESAIRSGKLKTVLETYELEPAPVHLVYPGQGQLPLKLRAFLDFAAPRLRARLSNIG